MDRNRLASVFYGEGPVPVVWATDCPVRFDVWNAFARPAPDDSGGRVDVILAINEEHGSRRVLDHFQDLQLYDCNPIASGSFVSAEMTLAELVRGVLPMTNLAGLVAAAQALPPEDEERILDASRPPPVVVSPFHDSSVERTQERARQLAWLVHLLATVIQGSIPARTRGQMTAATRAQAFTLLRTAEAEPSLTKLPEDPRNQVIDRRRRYPIVSVTLNRTASTAVTRSRVTVKADAAEHVFDVDCSNIGWAVVDSGIDVAHPAFFEWWPGPDGSWQRGQSRVDPSPMSAMPIGTAA